jgi:DNA-binding LytR/AlgR family response regulator
MKGYEMTAGKEIRSCMVLTSNEKLRGRLSLILEKRDILVYAPEDGHNAWGYLYVKNIDFLVIDADCWDNRDWGLPGFEFAFKLRECSSYVTKPIIILSNDDLARLYAYEQFNCIGYVLKPVNEKQFSHAVEKALLFSEKSSIKNPKYVKSNSVYFSFYFDEIMYMDVRNRAVCLHLQSGQQHRIANAHLSYYADEAIREGFMQIRRDIMVNMHYIANVDFNNRTVKVLDGTELGIGCAYKTALEAFVKRHGFTTDGKNNFKPIPFANELGYTT